MKNKNNSLRLWPWLILFAMLGGIFMLSTGAFTAEATGKIFGPYNNLARKFAHVSEYAVLFIGMRWVFGRTTNKLGGTALSLIALLLCVLYAGSDEWHQLFVPGRTSSLFDVALDSCGAAFGCVVWSVCQWTRKLRKRT